MIRFGCPGCGAVYAVDDVKAGKTGMCPKCQVQFVIPPPPPEPPTPPSLPDPPAASPPPEPASAVVEPVADGAAGPVEVAPCPGCRSRLSVNTSDIGVNVECPTCRTVFVATPASTRVLVPREGSEAEPAGERRGSRTRREDDRLTRRSRRRRDDEDEDDDRTSRRRSRWGDDEDDDRPRSRRRRGRPDAIGAVGGMLLGGGIYALVHVLAITLSSALICCLWPGVYLGAVWAILAIIRGSSLLNDTDVGDAPKTLCILQIITIINGDVINLILGIIGLVMLNNPDVQDYYDRRRQD